MPDVVPDIATLRARLQTERNRGASIGFVPTMGALHAGHARLLETARRENDFVVASIFVNPLQFDRKDDLEAYPRTLDWDLRLCDEFGTDLVFSPSVGELYPQEQVTFVDSPTLAEHLCGPHRPGHFRGVATVVMKLLNIVQPTRAYFGEKDAQQLVVIRRMAQDLNVPVEIVPVPTVREPDGLALSSRNKHLSPQEREIAPVLCRALRKAIELLEAGKRDAQTVRERALAVFQPFPAARVEYFEISDPDTLAPVTQVTGRVLVAGAMWLGSTRLIDNMSWRQHPTDPRPVLR